MTKGIKVHLPDEDGPHSHLPACGRGTGTLSLERDEITCRSCLAIIERRIQNSRRVNGPA